MDFIRKFKKDNKLYIINDGANWALDEEAKSLKSITRSLGINSEIYSNHDKLFNTNIHFTSEFFLSDSSVFKKNNKISFDYFHGRPGLGNEFDELLMSLKKNVNKISRVRVTHEYAENLMLELGFSKDQVFKIYIGVDTKLFTRYPSEQRVRFREKLGIPKEAFVIGSFQKDGNGWGEGLEPKLIKGPDIFLKSVEALKNKIPDLWVVLTGPARGYVKNGLEELKIPYKHYFLKTYEELPDYYNLLDCYLVSSREEGGPKAILESMATGVPIVSTKVGQATELIKTGVNGYLCDIEDSNALAHSIEKVRNIEDKSILLQAAFQTAKENSHINQANLWEAFFKGYVIN